MNKTYKYDFREVAALAEGRWLEIFSFLTNGGLELQTANLGRGFAHPKHGGKDRFRLDKDAAFRGGSYDNQEGSNSDGFATLACALAIRPYEALAMVAEYLNAPANHTSKAAKPLRQATTTQQPTYEISAEEAATRKAKLNKYWRQTSRLTQPTSKRVVQYLMSRGIKGDFYLDENSLRFHPSTWYKAQSGNLVSTPAFVQMWTAADGTPINTHKILLSKVSVGKAEVEEPKLMMRPTAKMTGGAVRIGEPAFGTLSVATGVETALSVTEVTKQACWATLNDNMLEKFIPPQDVNHLTIWADNDFLKPKYGRMANSGVEAAYALRDRLKKERPDMKIVVKIPPKQGQDWNDLLVAGKLDAFRG